MIFKLGELFCGPGGIAKGALSADIGMPGWGIEFLVIIQKLLEQQYF